MRLERKSVPKRNEAVRSYTKKRNHIKAFDVVGIDDFPRAKRFSIVVREFRYFFEMFTIYFLKSKTPNPIRENRYDFKYYDVFAVTCISHVVKRQMYEAPP